MDEIISIFTESSEDKGILYNSYKFLNNKISMFLNEIEVCVTNVKKGRFNNNLGLRDKISEFKNAVNVQYYPSEIDKTSIKSTRELIKNFRKSSELLLKKYASLRYAMSYGGNYLHGVLNRGHVYSRQIDPERYDLINRNLRDIDRSLDWVEKILMDLLNMIDQDLNLLTIVDITYLRKKIYESGELDELFENGVYINEENIPAPSPNESINEKIMSNFNDIYFIMKENYGIDLYPRAEVFTEGLFGIPFNESKMSNESLVFSKANIGNTPEELYEWMHNNISYDNSIREWKLKAPSEVFETKKGNCHDQALFASFVLNSMNIVNEMMFFIEFKEDSPVGGNTHTFTWYRTGGPGYSDFKEPASEKPYKGPYKYYWFENAWEPYAGIHGPYDDLDKLKDAVFDAYKNDDDINQNKFDGIMFGYPHGTMCGMSLGEYVNKCIIDDKKPYHISGNNVSGLDNLSEKTLMEYVEKSFSTIENLMNNQDETEYDVMTEAANPGTIPDKLYFGASKPIPGKTIGCITPRGLFLTPSIAIASIFIIDRFKEAKKYFNDILSKNNRVMFRNNYNIEYGEWDSAIDQQKPLDMVHMYHNIPEFKEKISGTSVGYIYQVDVSSIKNDLQTYTTDDRRYELVYKGTDNLPITGSIKHRVNWELTYKSNGTRGTFETKVIKEDGNESRKLACPDYMCSKCETIFKDEDVTILDVPKKDYENAASEFPGWDGRWGHLAMVLCPTCGERNYVITEGMSYMNESKKNGTNRKKLYFKFVDWAKEKNQRNVFGNIFEWKAFTEKYPFMPMEMRYFYRLANPVLCVLDDNLTFFQVSELENLNRDNSKFSDLIIFAGTLTDMIVFNSKDKKVYKATDDNGDIKLKEVIATSFDKYIQDLIGQGDILNGG